MDLSIIKRLRKEKGLSQQELGKKLGVSGAYIQQIESNKKNPSMKTLSRIAESLDVPTIMLTGEKEIINLINVDENIQSIKKDDLVRKLFELATGEKTLDTTPIIHYIEKDKMDLCIFILNKYGYTTEIKKDTVMITDDSNVIKNIEVDLHVFLDFSKNIHWALDSFISNFIDEYSDGLTWDDEEN